jgi:Enoyl-(Acyl carrier protein) reductase
MRCAWPHMLGQNYGRVVMTASTGMFGLPGNVGYATAKSALIGMAKSMTVSAGDRNIKINLIAPNAWTRMAGGPSEGMDSLRQQRQSAPPKMEPELVAPLVAFLANEACDVSGEIYVGGAGRFARLLVAATPGYLHPDTQPTIEDVAANWAAINDQTGYYLPASLHDRVGHYMSHR